jgi:hypothetical protein
MEESVTIIFGKLCYLGSIATVEVSAYENRL